MIWSLPHRAPIRGVLGPLAATIVVLLLNGCAAPAATAVDAGGLTREEALGRPLREQFELVRQRDERMREILREVQLALASDDVEWEWAQKGVGPIGGGNAYALAGMTGENSYFLLMQRMLPGGGRAGPRPSARDLGPLRELAEAEGWNSGTEGDDPTRLTLRVDTGEGFRLRCETYPDGGLVVEIMSETYWGDASELLREIVGRLPEEELAVEHSRAGEYMRFPGWEDPIVFDPKIGPPGSSE